MSTLMLASASGPKIAAATPGLSSIWRTEIWASSLEKAMPVTTWLSMISSSLQISVPGGGAVRVDILGLVEAGADENRHVVHHAEFHRAHLQDLGALRGQFQHVLERDLVEPPRLRNHARVGGVDAIDVGIDVAAVGMDRGRNRHRRGVRTAAPERGDSAGLRIDALEAGDDGDFLAVLEAVDRSRCRRSRESAPRRGRREVLIGICQPCQERAWMPMRLQRDRQQARR